VQEGGRDGRHRAASFLLGLARDQIAEHLLIVGIASRLLVVLSHIHLPSFVLEYDGAFRRTVAPITHRIREECSLYSRDGTDATFSGVSPKANRDRQTRQEKA
jgi:hypothetical protein